MKYPWIWGENGIYITNNSEGFHVWRTFKLQTHALCDSSYGQLNLALSRALYLSRGTSKGIAKLAMKLEKELI